MHAQVVERAQQHASSSHSQATSSSSTLLEAKEDRVEVDAAIDDFSNRDVNNLTKQGLITGPDDKVRLGQGWGSRI